MKFELNRRGSRVMLVARLNTTIQRFQDTGKKR